MSVLDGVPSREDRDSGAEYALEECDFALQYPGLFEVIARQRYKSNPRATGKLLIFVDCGKASVMLSDRHKGMVAFYKKETLGAALEGLERALQGNSVDWRPDKHVR